MGLVILLSGDNLTEYFGVVKWRRAENQERRVESQEFRVQIRQTAGTLNLTPLPFICRLIKKVQMQGIRNSEAPSL
jgi:hypothetical protein